MSNVPNDGSKYGKHLEEVTSPTKPTVINDTNLTPKQTPLADPTPGQQARSQADKVSGRAATGKGLGGIARKPKKKGLTAKNARNAGKRMQKGMGLPGDHDGVNKTAMALYNRDLEIANRTGKKTNSVAPGESPATESFHVHGMPHQRMAQVMHFYGQPEEKIRNLGKGSGATGEIKFDMLHTAMVEHKNSQIEVPSDTKGATHWEHPRTGEHHAIAANHPDMPASFTKKAGESQTVTIGSSGKMIMNDPVTEGWHPMKLHGTDTTVMRQHKAPTGTPLVDHLRSSIAGSGASTSISSRKKGSAIATDLAQGMQRTGPAGKLPGNNYINYQVTGYKERGAGQPASPVLKPKDFPAAPEGEPVSNVVEAATPKTKKATVRPLQRGVVTRKVRGGVEGEKLATSAKNARAAKTKKIFSQQFAATQPSLPGLEKAGRDVRVPAVATPEYETHQGPLESWHSRGSTEIPLGKKEPMLSPTIQRKTGKATTIVAGGSESTGVASARSVRAKATAELTAAHPAEDHSVPAEQMHFPGMGMSRQFAGGTWTEAKNLSEKTRDLQDKSEQGTVPAATTDIAPEKRPTPKPRDTRSHKNKRR